MKSKHPAILPPASPREDEAVAPASKGGRIGLSGTARPAPETSKKAPTPDSPPPVKIAAARSKPAKKVRGRPKVSAAKNASKAKPVTKPSRKATPGSKQDSVVALLRQPGGASIDILVKATGWQPHSVRGFLAGTVRKKLKLQLQSQKVDGTRTYQIKAGKIPATTKKSRNG